MSGRIDPELAREIQRQEDAGDPGTTISVIVECAGDARVEEEGASGLERLEGKLRALQQPVVARLEALGSGPVGRSALVNALFASLTPAQVRDIAQHPLVRAVRLTRPEQVTT